MNVEAKMKDIKHFVLGLLVGFLFLFVPKAVVGQTNVEISGKMEKSVGRKVELFGYRDMLTCNEVLLDSCMVAADGKFDVGCYVNYPRLVFLQVENYTQSFYVEPGRKYEVYVGEFDWNVDEQRNVFLDPVVLPLEFLHLDSNELNLKIMRFDEQVDSFVSENRERLDFRYRPDRKLWKKESENWIAEYGGEQNGFFGRYVEYRVLEMGLAMRLDSRKRLIEKYIANEPIRYYDENYMRFFLAVYDHMVSGGMKKIGKHRMMEWVRTGNLQNYLDSIGLDPLLRNEQVRELAVLESLKESYYDKDYDRAGVRNMVEKLARETKFPEHKVLAESLIEEWPTVSSLQSEVSSRWDFELPDVEKTKVRLSDFKGKWVYVSFVRVGDPNSQKELETMAHFRDTVYAQGNVVFVTVVCDREFQKMYHFLKNNRKGSKCRWTWLHFDGDYRMLERWGVVSYPYFVLLDPEGHQVYDWTPAPGSGILLHGPWVN